MTKWNIESMCGYKPITTFWNDFEIAEIFGKKAVIDTFKRAFKEWRGNYKYLSPDRIHPGIEMFVWEDPHIDDSTRRLEVAEGEYEE